MRTAVCLILLLGSITATSYAQPESASAPATPAAGTAALVSPVPRDQFADLWFANRRIITFRATVVPNDPAARAVGGRQRLERLVDEAVTGPVGARSLNGASIITVGGRDVFGIVLADVDASVSDLPSLTRETIERLQTALIETVEARAPARLAWEAARSLAATAALIVALAFLIRASRWAADRLATVTAARLKVAGERGPSEQIRLPRLLALTTRVVRVAAWTLSLVAIYTWLTYVLQQFPLTRPWGEALGGFLASTFTELGTAALSALPGLFTTALILLIARFTVRLLSLVFDGIEEGRVEIAWIDRPKVVPTRRLVTCLIWMFAIVVAYPYLPGSSTDAFKGVSVFVGLVVSLGSSGIVNQVMSGFMLTYSGALAPGDFAKIGDVEGTVTHLGVLSTKVRTSRNEAVTIPNAVVISGGAVNYSAYWSDGVYTATAVTIGYDTPWRQVEAMLLAAVDRTPGIRHDRPPKVQQTDLADFYAEYTVLVCLETPAKRNQVLAVLRAHIQDVFNEYGVQIMSPHYRADPVAAKVVPREHWFDPPALPPTEGSPSQPTARPVEGRERTRGTS